MACFFVVTASAIVATFVACAKVYTSMLISHKLYMVVLTFTKFS